MADFKILFDPLTHGRFALPDAGCKNRGGNCGLLGWHNLSLEGQGKNSPWSSASKLQGNKDYAVTVILGYYNGKHFLPAQVRLMDNKSIAVILGYFYENSYVSEESLIFNSMRPCFISKKQTYFRSITRNVMIKVITYGTFDVFHYGHFYLLERAKMLGDHLTVCVSTDQFNKKKRKHSKLPFEERKRILEHITFCDQVLPENNWEQKICDIKKLNIDIFTIGKDWEGKFDFLRAYCKVIYLPRTLGISSSQIKQITLVG